MGWTSRKPTQLRLTRFARKSRCPAPASARGMAVDHPSSSFPRRREPISRSCPRHHAEAMDLRLRAAGRAARISPPKTFQNRVSSDLSCRMTPTLPSADRIFSANHLSRPGRCAVALSSRPCDLPVAPPSRWWRASGACITRRESLANASPLKKADDTVNFARRAAVTLIISTRPLVETGRGLSVPIGDNRGRRTRSARHDRSRRRCHQPYS